MKTRSRSSFTHPHFQILCDPTGNSFVENPHAPRSDPSLEVSHFRRTREQDHELAIYTSAEIAENSQEHGGLIREQKVRKNNIILHFFGFKKKLLTFETFWIFLKNLFVILWNSFGF
jgi:hypothetical protein